MSRPDLDAWQHHNFDPFDLDRMWDEVARSETMSQEQPTHQHKWAVDANHPYPNERVGYVYCETCGKEKWEAIYDDLPEGPIYGSTDERLSWRGTP